MGFIPLLAIIAYGLLHSFMAALGPKRWVRQKFGDRVYEGFYRLFYNVFSVVTFIPVAVVLLISPAHVLWEVPLPWAAVLVILQLIALGCLIIAVLQADPLRFAGLKQALAYLRGESLPLPQENLQTGGFYRLVRHPLYLFSLLTLWPTPVMTDTFLGFVIGATIYFIVGSHWEEQRLADEFGEAYQSYRRQVPWMLPLPRRRP